MSVAVVKILPTLVGSRWTSGWVCAYAADAKYGWLLREPTAAVATAETTATMNSIIAYATGIGGYALLLSGGIDVGWRLLGNGQAELLNACQLALLLCGGICGAIVVHGGHTGDMICSWDGRLVYKRNCIGPIFFKGFD